MPCSASRPEDAGMEVECHAFLTWHRMEKSFTSHASNPQRKSCWLGPMTAPVLAGNRTPIRESTLPVWLLCLPFLVMNLHVSVCIVTRLRAGQLSYRGSVPGRNKTFVSSSNRPAHPAYYSMGFGPEGKAVGWGRESYHSFPPSADTKNEWSHSATPYLISYLSVTC